MLSRKELLYFIGLLLFVNLTNILFEILRLYEFVIIRPLVIHDYFWMCIFLALRVPAILTAALFFLIFSLDLLNQASAIFLFKAPEFVKNLKFVSLYKLSTPQVLSMGLFLTYLGANYFAIQRFHKIRMDQRNLLLLFLGVFLFTVCIDFLNGGSHFSKSKIIDISKNNLSGSYLKDLRSVYSNLTSEPPEPTPLANSPTFKAFENDSTGNQLLIVVESWGLLRDLTLRNNFEADLLNLASKTGWSAEIDSTQFKGSTTNAEMRELLDLSGDYRYFMTESNAKKYRSIFTVKKKQGYATIAGHSFSGNMFDRNIWWKNIGIDSTYFFEDGISKMRVGESELDYSTPFPSLKDEFTFSMITKSAGPSEKLFAYLLTENSHLPYFKQASPQTKTTLLFTLDADVSAVVKDQFGRIQELLNYFITNAYGQNWSKVLIVGDHMPPFSKDADRHAYSEKKVPYIILSRN